MSLVKFISGLSSDLPEKAYEDGAIYFVFPDGQHDNGHIYLDIKGSRHAISAAYDDSSIIDRLEELERVSLVHCTGISLSVNSIIMSTNTSTTIVATAGPQDCTDLINWTVSDDSVCESVSATQTNNTSTIILTGLADGTATITATCGECFAICSIEVQSGMLVEHVLLENYTCDGTPFMYTAPIDLSHGQYIEVSLNVADVDQIKQNIISFGSNISGTGITTEGYRFHCYTSATASRVHTYMRMFIVAKKASQSNIEFNIGNTTGDMVIKLDATGFWLNGTLLTPPASAEAMWNTILNEFRTNFTSFDVGSAEGTTRSTAHYNYIKYYAYEE